MTKEEAITILNQIRKILLNSNSWLESTHQPITEAFDMAIEAIKSIQPNAPNALNALDCISRQAALDTIRPLQTYKLFEGDDMILIDKAEVQTELMMLPSAQPEQKKGKWLPLVEADENGEPYQVGVYCSECYNGEVYEPRYCSCCGAKMEE